MSVSFCLGKVMDPSPLSRRANRTLASKSSRSISSPPSEPSEPNQLPAESPTGPTHSAQRDHSSTDVVTIGHMGDSDLSSGVRGDSEKDEILELMDVADLADVADVDRDGDEVPMTVDDAWALDDFSPDLEWIQPGPTPTTAGTPTTSTTSTTPSSDLEQSELMVGGKTVWGLAWTCGTMHCFAKFTITYYLA